MATSASSSGPAVFDLENELTCSICTDILFQPLTLLDCLHTFCGACLKEWFAWQATSAIASSRRNVNPYTCPSCRAPVRETKADFRLTALAEGYLKANPGRGKSEEEKEESRKHYSPGESVVPSIRSSGIDEVDSEDERILAHTRDLSLAEVGVRPASDRRNRTLPSAAASARHRPSEHARHQQTSAWVAQQTARRRELDERHVEHQPSLRSLLSGSSSDVSATDVQEEILQSIISEGLVEGIDLDSLTPQQEEELTERIAEAYRRRQRNRDRSRHRDRQEEVTHARPGASQQPQTASRPRNESPSRRQPRASPVQPVQNDTQQQSRARPPISRPHLFEQPQSTPDRPRTQRRSTSQSGQDSRQPEAQPVLTPPAQRPASRSVTDLSSNRAPNGEPSNNRQQSSSNNARSTTDPTHLQSEIRQVREAAMLQSGRDPLPARSRDPSPQTAVRPAPSNAALAPEPVTAETAPGTASLPSIACARCSKQNIAGELHYHCSRCRNGNFDLCLACYRGEKGCDHWFGFGHMAMYRWQRAAPEGGWPKNYDLPHVLSARRYIPNPTPNPPTNASRPILQEGAFCEICFTFANDLYWYCDTCLEGAWGHCHACLLRGHHCTHPLLPLTHPTVLRAHGTDATTLSTIPTISPPHLLPTPSLTSPIPATPFHLSPTATLVDCDICHLPIPPRSPRHYCYVCSSGDYDICQPCYSALNLPANDVAWRRCPAPAGHRMALVVYADAPRWWNLPGGALVRTTVADVVGGWRLRDEDRNAEAPVMGSAGSLGKRFLATWNRLPVREREEGDLVFPRNAEIREAEALNEDWAVGVYAGSVGVFPRNHAREIRMG